MFTLNPQESVLHPLMQQVSLFIDEGIIIYDMAGTVISYNPQALELFPHLKERLKDKSALSQSWVMVTQDMQPVEPGNHPLAVTMRTGNPVQNNILGVGRTLESLRWVSVSTKMIAYLSGEYILATFHDVSDVVSLNRTLLEQERYLQMMVASLDDIIFEVDRNGVFLKVWTNQEEYLLTAPAQFLGRNCKEFLPSELALQMVHEIELAITESKSRTFEYQLQVNQVTQWYLARVNPMPPCNERITLLITNINEQKRTALKIQETEARWKFALEGSGQGLWDWNLTTNDLYMSPIYLSMLGYDEHSFSYKLNSWEKLVHPADLARTYNDIHQHLAEQSKLYFNEHRLQCRDGSYKWILDRGMVVTRDATGKPLRMVGTHSDISDRIQHLERIKLSEQKFNNAFQYSGIGMGLVSADGLWLEVNDELCKITGYPREEMLGITFQQITHPDDLALDLDLVNQVLNREIESYSMEKRYLHKQGHYVWVLLTVSMVWNADDTPRYFISQLQEISELKALVNSLASKNDELEMTMIDLEQKLKQLAEFNEIVTHNLRGAAGNILMLAGELEKITDPAEQSEYLRLLKMCGETMMETLQDMMRILEVRLNQDIPFETCHFETITTKVLQQLQIDVLHKKAEIRTAFGAAQLQYPIIYLESILHNLISNALKYTSPSATPVITITTYEKDNRCYLSVKDNGLGIDLERYGHQVFKLHRVFHQGYDSKGVGLFITKNHIETLGGKIDIKSAPGKGSEFIVMF